MPTTVIFTNLFFSFFGGQAEGGANPKQHDNVCGVYTVGLLQPHLVISVACLMCCVCDMLQTSNLSDAFNLIESSSVVETLLFFVKL